ncbi:MAG: FecR family protein, partial [Polyangiaceae bacterium]
MSQLNTKNREAEVLRQLIGEMRETLPPSINSERISAMLVETIEAEKRARPAQTHGTGASHWLVFAAAAAFVVVMLSQQGAGRDPSTDGGRRASISAQAVDLRTVPYQQADGEGVPVYRVAALRSGVVVESQTEPVRFRLDGVVTWTLAPKTRVRVRSMSAPHEIVLERGSVFAEVKPQLGSDELNETFAVIAGTSRVAVHGTVFSVQRDGDRVIVEVTRGAVSVGPVAARGPTTGRLLVGPARAAFTTEQGRLAADQSLPVAHVPAGADLAQEAAPVRDQPQPVAASPSESDASSVRVALPTTRPVMAARDVETDADDAGAVDDARDNEPDARDRKAELEPPAEPKMSIDQARAMVLACLNSNRDAGQPSDLQVTVSSEVSVKLDDAGKIRAVRFSPPLKPSLQQHCGGALFGQRPD